MLLAGDSALITGYKDRCKDDLTKSMRDQERISFAAHSNVVFETSRSVRPGGRQCNLGRWPCQ
jgi:hypothetical protein